MAAEIGSMRVYQEIDALRTMNINPIHYLVLPRILALAAALPMLVIFAILIGWFGGSVVANFNHLMDIPFRVFFANMKDIVELGDVVNGVFKSFCFAVIIGTVSCHQGLTTIGGPRGIGRSVTKAVVNSIVLIGIFDYKSFGDQEVIRGIDFEVRPGEIFVIMGPSGSGKSVLLKHLIGLETPDAGEILINHEPITTPEIAAKYRMALVFQSGALLNSLTVGENVGLYLTEHRLNTVEEIEKIVAEKLSDVGHKDAIHKMPGELSGGMKKRAAIARALVIRPQLILYDEPTSELDPISSVVIGNEILGLNQRIGVTSLVVSHDRDLAFGVADRIAVMSEGKILTIGTPAEVKNFKDPLVQNFLNADFKREN